jgi:hypothetical protein
LRLRRGAREDDLHVLSAALEHLDVALLLAETHVLVVLVLRREERALLRVHLDERFAARLLL